MSIRSLIVGLTRAEVAFVIVGMAAGQLHGSRLLTEDLDIVYRDDLENVDRLVSYLTSVDAYVKELWPNEGFGSAFSRDRLVAEKSLTLGTSEGEIDVLDRIDGIGSFEDVREASQPIAIDGQVALVVTLDGLIRSKRAANRPKDAAHLPDLECLRELKKRDAAPSPEA